MRYLNKIVFINSAHVPYAEIKLDGNVHFIGTQGVGKSTLLRAILFFYNADKSRLGIRTQDKQKSYDEFYLPHPNSYIVYEVVRESGTFFVVSFISRGRTAFRIVDCAYERRFFIDDEGMARNEWGRISEIIGTKVFKSNIIRGYEEFRDIIYGNSLKVQKELRRFSLMESTRYQNIPRTIQNIFLNQSLESRVIKNTIIDSMDFANDSIDLNRYREELKKFRQQYEDIAKWFVEDRNGRVKVRLDAEKVKTQYELYDQLRRDIRELCGYIRFAVKRDSGMMPRLAEELTELAASLARQKKLQSEEEDKYNAERDRLNQTVGRLKDFIDKVKKKRAYYDEIDIVTLAARMEKEDELKKQHESLKKQAALLTEHNQEVNFRYDALFKEIDNAFEEMKNIAGQKIVGLQQEQNAQTKKLDRMFFDEKERLDNDCRQQRDALTLRREECSETVNELRLQEQRTMTANPYEEEMEALEKKRRQLAEDGEELTRKIADLQHETDQITFETELQLKDIERVCDGDTARIERKAETIMAETEKCEALLQRQKGSFIEWLTQHVDDWENSIGLVADEESVLYNTRLNPQLQGDSGTFFGVKIDTAAIDRDIRTPEDIKREKTDLEEKAAQLRKQLAERRTQLETDRQVIRRKPEKRLKELRAEKLNCNVALKGIPRAMEKLESERKILDKKLSDWREQTLNGIRRKTAEAVKEFESVKKRIEELDAGHRQQIEKLTRELKRQTKDIDTRTKQETAELAREIEQKRSNARQQKAALRERMNSELKGLGVDIERLNEIHRQVEDIAGELAFIDSRRQDYMEWKIDCRELFDKEQEVAAELSVTKKKIAGQQQRFEERKRRLDNRINELARRQRELQERRNSIGRALARVEDFRHTASCPPDFDNAVMQETARPLAELFDDLHTDMLESGKRQEEFRHAVDVFKANFPPQNIFEFQTELNGQEAYIDFAVRLNDFLADNKIETYRTRTNEYYASIIQRISRNVSDLSQHEADIRATINEINKDFRDNNFAGVIKDIELRMVESNERIMQQLFNIKRFDDEHGFDIGSLNLFSTTGDNAEVNTRAVRMLMALIEQMDAEARRDGITLADTFKLEFKVKENDNDTSWVEKLSNVGSDGTDILVKAMVNIMLINVFKRKASKKFGDFKLHCMMDEIGKLHPNNVQGILDFANSRNIRLINSSPTTYNATAYKYTYALSKDEQSNTCVKTLLTVR